MNDSSNHGLDTVVWHKQFWPWFLIILLSVSVVSSLVTVYFAVRDPDPVVDGNYYKHGLTINEQLENTPATPANAPIAQPAIPSGEKR